MMMLMVVMMVMMMFFDGDGDVDGVDDKCPQLMSISEGLAPTNMSSTV